MNMQKMIKRVFSNPALIGYLVKRLNKDYSNKQIGKTIIQKMVYLLVHENICKFDYSMYHYGPYSAEVSGELNFAEDSGIVNIKWINEKGYLITPGRELKNFDHLVTTEEKQKIDIIVQKFGQFNAVELSLIATALFLKDNYDVSDEELSETVRKVKTQYTIDYISSLLKKAGILN
jgi:uncharacterized protein YwgA